MRLWKKLYKHKDYEEYYSAQLRKNKRKFNKVWVKEEEIKIISDHISSNIIDYKFGICHGVRNGKEIDFFKKFLNINILGTEISPKADAVENTIHWDLPSSIHISL